MSDPDERHKAPLDLVIEDAVAGDPFIFYEGTEPKAILLSYARYENLLQAEAVIAGIAAFVAARTDSNSKENDAVSG